MVPNDIGIVQSNLFELCDSVGSKARSPIADSASRSSFDENVFDYRRQERFIGYDYLET